MTAAVPFESFLLSGGDFEPVLFDQLDQPTSSFGFESAFTPTFQARNPEFFGTPPVQTLLVGAPADEGARGSGQGFGGFGGFGIADFFAGLVGGIGPAAAPFLDAFVPPEPVLRPELFTLDDGEGGFFVAGDEVLPFGSVLRERDELRRQRALQRPERAQARAEAKAIRQQAKVDQAVTRAEKRRINLEAKAARRGARQETRQALKRDRIRERLEVRPLERFDARKDRKQGTRVRRTLAKDERRDEKARDRALRREDRQRRKDERKARRGRGSRGGGLALVPEFAGNRGR